MPSSEKVPESLARRFDDAPDITRPGDMLTLKRLAPPVTYKNHTGEYVGELYRCPLYDGEVYFSRRKHEVHFYRKARGFAIDDEILFDLDNRGVEVLLIGVVEDGHVYEFDIEQYLTYEDGEKFEYDDGPQRCTPLVNAQHVWRDALGDALDEQ